MTFSAVILAGGQSSRMGENKALLTLDGRRFIDKIYDELDWVSERFISVDDAAAHPELAGYPLVGDVYLGAGPMGGLYAALKSTAADAILAVSCDLPLFSRALGEKLIAAMDDKTDAVVPHTLDGRVHPLCAVYSRRCLETFGFQLMSKNYRMTDALDKLHTNYIFAQAFSRSLTNVNTPEEYALLCKEEKKN